MADPIAVEMGRIRPSANKIYQVASSVDRFNLYLRAIGTSITLFTDIVPALPTSSGQTCGRCSQAPATFLGSMNSVEVLLCDECAAKYATSHKNLDTVEWFCLPLAEVAKLDNVQPRVPQTMSKAQMTAILKDVLPKAPWKAALVGLLHPAKDPIVLRIDCQGCDCCAGYRRSSAGWSTLEDMLASSIVLQDDGKPKRGCGGAAEQWAASKVLLSWEVNSERKGPQVMRMAFAPFQDVLSIANLDD